ncbi:Hypothetical protein FKW44_000845 [Caligus rogercresseyi]|uniref:Uncharacterized protein n=1 Tax=Caligus rogercresseyi TaxID=217165 RepID=A0A7T8KI51_CALRO|nr:Hypothetical protein FKW44_000845 [Caligus rogercresseyi]
MALAAVLQRERSWRPQRLMHVPHRYCVACKGSRLSSEWIRYWSGGPIGLLGMGKTKSQPGVWHRRHRSLE